MPRCERFSDSAVCSGNADFQTRTRSGVFTLYLSANRRSVRKLLMCGSSLRRWGCLGMTRMTYRRGETKLLQFHYSVQTQIGTVQNETNCRVRRVLFTLSLEAPPLLPRMQDSPYFPSWGAVLWFPSAHAQTHP